MMKKTTSYEQDFYAWLITNVQLIRQGRFAENIVGWALVPTISLIK
jgi:hypothetical protein